MKLIGPLFICIAVFASGCAFNRGNVAALSKRQDQYYADLQTSLKKDRNDLTAGLTRQLEVSRMRERTLVDWQRDLAKFDVLLRVGSNAKGDKQALLTEATASDLSTLDRLLALNSIDQARLDAILSLYDSVIKAVDALQKNNQAITKYLESDDEKYALQSLDIAALATSISDLRDMRDQMKGTQAKSAEVKAADAEKLQKNIEKAQEALLKGLSASKSK
jgi:hypothetical protein